MIVEGRVQTTDNAGGEGAIQALRLGKSGEAFTSDAHGRYYDACRRGNLYSYNQSTVGALSNSATAVTGLICYNPAGSGRAVSLLNIIISQATIPTGQFNYSLWGGPQSILPTSQTLTGVGIQNLAFGKYSAGGSVIQVSSISTVQAAVFLRTISGGGAATEASQITPVIINDEVSEVMLYPGAVLAVQSTVTAVSTLMTYVGEEVPVP